MTFCEQTHRGLNSQPPVSLDRTGRPVALRLAGRNCKPNMPVFLGTGTYEPFYILGPTPHSEWTDTTAAALKTLYSMSPICRSSFTNSAASRVLSEMEQMSV